jgi:hypothetical protein
MKKFDLLFILPVFLFLSFQLLAQDATLLMNTKDVTFEKLKYVTQNKDYFLTITDLNSKDFQLTKFSASDLSMVSQKEFKLPQANGERVEFLNALYFKGRICLFTTSYANSKKKRFYSLYVTEISDDGNILSGPRVVDSLSWNTKCSSVGFRQVLSADSSKLLLYHKIDECDDKTVLGKYAFTIWNDKLNVIFDKKLELPKSFSKYDLSKFVMDNENNIYFLEKEYEKDSYIDGDLFQISVDCYKTKEDKFIRNPIDIGEKRFLNLDLQLTKKEDVVISGAYAIDRDFGSNWQNISSMKGVFCGLISHETGKTKVLYKKDMDELLTGERTVHTGGASLVVDDGKHLYRTNLEHTGIFNEDKAVLFFAFNHTVGNVHFTGSLVGMFFDFNNEKENKLMVFPKTETNNSTPNTVETLQDILMMRNNKVHLLYNYNRELIISANGEFTDNQLYEVTKANKSYLISQKTMQVLNPNELFILATDGPVPSSSFVSYRPAKLVFKN